jgi:hypothetical protein
MGPLKPLFSTHIPADADPAKVDDVLAKELFRVDTIGTSTMLRLIYTYHDLLVEGSYVVHEPTGVRVLLTKIRQRLTPFCAFPRESQFARGEDGKMVPLEKPEARTKFDMVFNPPPDAEMN